MLKASKGEFLGVQEKGGFPLYLAKAGERYETPACGSAYRSFAQYTKEDIIKELSAGGHPIYDNDVVQRGGINPGLEYYGGYAYDFNGETIAETEERGGNEDVREDCTVFGMPILINDLKAFIGFARRMSRNIKIGAEKAGHKYSIPGDIQSAIEALKKQNSGEQRPV